MGIFRRFEDIEAWQLARCLTREGYALTRAPGFAQDSALRDQIRRACISITSDIAEGHERSTPRDFARFLSIARASCAEVRSQSPSALDREYVSPDDFARLTTLGVCIGAALAALIRSLLSYAVFEPDTTYDASSSESSPLDPPSRPPPDPSPALASPLNPLPSQP